MEMATVDIDTCRTVRLTPHNVDAAVRRLAAARVIEEAQRCLSIPMGLPYLAAWFQGEGREWLDLAGMGHLLDVPSGELAGRVFKFAPDLLDNPGLLRRCIYCVHLVGNGRVQCDLGVWEEWDLQAEYATATVRHSSKRFPGCNLFEEGEGEAE